MVVNTPIAITNSAPPPTFTCGGCYVVADVAGIEFGTATITQLQSATVSVGLNYTSVISSVVGVTEFSIAPTGVIGSGTLFNYGTAIVFSGVTLCVVHHWNTYTMSFLANVPVGLHPHLTTSSRHSPSLLPSLPMVDAV